MKRFLSVMIILSMISAAVFAGGESESAQRVTAYTTLDEELAREVFEAFTADTGIEVDWVRLSTGEAVARIEAEQDNPQASVWYGGVGLGHIEAKQKGLTTPYQSSVASMADQFRDSEWYWSGIYAGPLAFESNVNMLERNGLEQPMSWEDLLDPSFEGEIQMANPGSSGTAYNVLATMVQILGEDEAFEYMQDLNSNISQYTRSGSAPGRNAAIGEITVAIGYAHDGVRLIAEGYPLKLSFPSEGTGYEIASISMIAGGPENEREAAETLIDWALGERAAELYATKYVVPFVDVELADGAVPISQVNTIDQDDVWAAANKERLVNKWNELIGSDATTE